MHRRTLLGAALAATVLAGCGGDPYADQRREAEQAVRAQATPTFDGRDAEPPRAQPAAPGALDTGAQPTAREALEAFAERYVNWSWEDPDAQQRALAALATGSLARELRAAIGSGDAATLDRERPAQRGSVQIVQLRGGDALRRRGVVVTREQSYHDERPDEGGLRWNVYTGVAERGADGWRLVEWQAQP
jgi:hypothetical protein